MIIGYITSIIKLERRIYTEKKNNFIIAIIVALSILVGLLGGYFLSNTLADRNQDNSNNSINNNNEESKQPNNENNDISSDNNNNVEKDYSLSEAEKLMNKYYSFIYSGFYDYIKSGKKIEEYNKYDTFTGYVKNNEDFKDSIAFQKVASKIDTTCDYESEEVSSECRSGGDYAFFVSYNDVLSSKKLLFGPNATLEKRNFRFSGTGEVHSYYYVPDKNGFLGVVGFGGGDCNCSAGDAVISAVELGDYIKIKTYRYYIKFIDDDTNNNLKAQLGRNFSNMTNVILDISECERASNKSCITKKISNHIDKLDQYEYLFKQNNGNYYLAEINKLN